VGVEMNYREKLVNLIDKNGGLILTKQLSEAGIPRVYLSSMVNAGLLVKLERGVYIARDGYDDELYRYQVKYEKAIYSHETALFLHDLTDRDPIKYSITVPEGYNASHLRALNFKVYSIKKTLYSLGLSESKTAFGRMVKCYDLERTICDIVRHRNQIDIAVISDAVKRYAGRKDRNIPQLMRYAEKMRVVKSLSSYMEVVL
jgi:predicted transcriptional regulator of viral defense system